jgi:hypothetical protein
LSALLDRKPQLLRPLAAQLMPPPVAAIDPTQRLGIDLALPPTPADLQRALSAVLTGICARIARLGGFERSAELGAVDPAPVGSTPLIRPVSALRIALRNAAGLT